jgi:hypothetical protein
VKPHPRIRKTIKWGGAAVTVLLAVVWIGSRWFGAVVWYREARYVELAAGEALFKSDGSGPGDWLLTLEPFSHQGRFSWRFEWSDEGLHGWYVSVPLWFPVVALAILTGAAWGADLAVRSRERLGRCPKCNYDRTGLASGIVCPECGEKPTVA